MKNTMLSSLMMAGGDLKKKYRPTVTVRLTDYGDVMEVATIQREAPRSSSLLVWRVGSINPAAMSDQSIQILH